MSCTHCNNIKSPDLEVLPVWLSSFSLLISLLNREKSGSPATLEEPVNRLNDNNKQTSFCVCLKVFPKICAYGTILDQLLINELLINVSGGSFFLYRVGMMDLMVNAVPLPVIPLSRMTQIVASRPAPQTQNRGRRRVRLGLLGALIPPAASERSGQHRSMQQTDSSQRPLAFTQHCCSLNLSPGRYFNSGLCLR